LISAHLQAISEILLGALRRHAAFCNAVYPKQLHSLLVSRYRAGMHYGPHVDRALMGEATLWRTDLSLTLFLNEPDAYDGG
jgi:PKHD-type hydroxylase